MLGNEVEGVETQGYFWAVIKPRAQRGGGDPGVRLRTFTRPATIAVVIATSLGKGPLSIRHNGGKLFPVLDLKGRLLPNVYAEIVPMMSSDELALLGLARDAREVDRPDFEARVAASKR